MVVLTLDVADDRVQAVRAVVNPDKLARAATVLVRGLVERHVRLGAVHPALAAARAAAAER